jgi:hypothetical protein
MKYAATLLAVFAASLFAVSGTSQERRPGAPDDRGVRAWQYGRFEMKGQIDTRSGLWPAFWTLGVEGEWPGNGDIDINEFYRGRLLANAAWASDRRWVAEWNTFKKPITGFPARFEVDYVRVYRLRQ